MSTTTKKKPKEIKPDILTCKKFSLKEVGGFFQKDARTIKRWIDEGKYFDSAQIIKLDDGYLIPEYEVRRIMKFLMEREGPENIKEPDKKPKSSKKQNEEGGFVKNY